MNDKKTKPEFIQIIVALIAGVTTIIAVLFQTWSSKRINDVEFPSIKVDRQIVEKFDELTWKINQIDSVLNQLIIISESQEVSILVDEKFKETNQTIKTLYGEIVPLKDQVEGLRQSINPINPNEILTIARLKDEVIEIKENFSSYKERVDGQQAEFRDYILREKETSNRSTNLILVVLVPLVINFLYTVWKDFRKKDE